MDTLIDTRQEITETNQPINFNHLKLLYTCTDDFVVDNKEFQQCLKGCKW